MSNNYYYNYNSKDALTVLTPDQRQLKKKLIKLCYVTLSVAN